MSKNINPPVIILAGGRAERMEYPKPYLLFDHSSTFADKIIDEYYNIGCKDVIVVINHEFCTGKWNKHFNALSAKAKVIQNHFPERGRLYSVKLGTEEIGDCDHCFIQNIDNPFIDREILSALIENKNQNGYVLPVYQNKGGHPVIISRKIINYIRQTKNINTTLRDVLKLFERKEVKVLRKDILININTQEDYNLYF
ncbi:MAG: NTP transferase domain-containing protein [Bacteroidota bacterium]